MSPNETSTPLEGMTRAVADLWSQVIESGEHHVVFYDHSGQPARIRLAGEGYRIGWPRELGGRTEWSESERQFDSPREAAFHAFQGPSEGQ